VFDDHVEELRERVDGLGVMSARVQMEVCHRVGRFQPPCEQVKKAEHTLEVGVL
jgi:hypothetical protein